MVAPMIDQAFYSDTFFGELVPNQMKFERLERRAEEMVNEYAGYYFDSHTLTDLPLDADRLNVQKAICAQIEWFIDAGGVEELANTKQTTPTHATIGKFSYEKPAATTLPRSTAQRSNAAINYLRPTGLLYRGVGQYD